MTLGMHAAGTKRVFWTPKELGSALTFWIDASDASTVTLTSSKVSQIDDKSGNGRHATQATANNQPVIASATQNGRDALSFYADSTADWLSLASTGVSAQPFTLLGAVKFTNNSKNRTLFWNSVPLTLETISRDNSYVIYGGAELLATTTFTSNWSLYGATYNSTSSDIWLNAASIKSGNAGTSALTGGTTRIGQRSDAVTDQPMYGYVGEFLIVNGTLSTANRQRIEGYLAWRWGLQGNLPNDHPYKAATP